MLDPKIGRWDEFFGNPGAMLSATTSSDMLWTGEIVLSPTLQKKRPADAEFFFFDPSIQVSTTNPGHPYRVCTRLSEVAVLIVEENCSSKACN